MSTEPRILAGDCLEVMPTLDAGSVDAIVCDPPYGLAFMGKAWDHGVPGAPFWEAALCVAKPGAHLVAFGGTRTFHRLTCAIEDAGWEIRDCLSWLYGSGFPKSHNGPWGGTALKPAWEPIILARKPLIGTVAANVAVHGAGALNIDGTRLEAGRWPANVALDEEAGAILDGQTGTLISGANPTKRGAPKFRHAYGDFAGQAECTPVRGVDTGGASRFFYCAKASRAEREAGLEGMERKAKNWSSGEQSPGTFQSEGTDRTSTNHHPTVKPVTLMRWLCRLVTPAGGLVLDPFTGSGSTGVAAILEGFRFLGIEREAEYVAIAEARIRAATPEPAPVDPQLSIPL